MDGGPVGSSRFEVTIGGRRVGCSEVLGLALDPGLERPAAVTLRRAAGVDDAFLAWAHAPRPRKVAVTVLTPAGEPAVRYLLEGAVPVRWVGPALDALASAVAVEELVLAAADVRLA